MAQNYSTESAGASHTEAAVEAGMGATALSASVVVPWIEAGLLVPVASTLPDRAFTLVRHVER